MNGQEKTIDEGRYKKLISDAQILLDYAISSGFKREDGKKVTNDTIRVIEDASAKLKEGKTEDVDMVAFEDAYLDLSVLLSPITAQTLKDTDKTYGRTVPMLATKQASEAVIWSRKLTLITILFVIIAVAGESFSEIQRNFALPLDEVTGFWQKLPYYLQIQIQILVPFTYGGIGACAFLLRSCHHFIYKRIFDIRRIPEYLNRILLGMVSGGAIHLFISEVQLGEGETVELSAAALGFIAGYSTDFLFNTIERIVQAIFPKVGVVTVQRAQAQRTTSVNIAVEDLSLKDLLTKYESAADQKDKAFYKSLIEKLRDQL